MMELIHVKWKHFGRGGAAINTIINVFFILMWTIHGLFPSVPYTLRKVYTFPADSWRIVILIIAVLFTFWQVIDELKEFYFSRKSHKLWKEWRESELKRDIKFSHPRWPEEEQYLKQECRQLDEISPRYFSDFWNIFDWVCYFLLFVSLSLHISSIFIDSNELARTYVRIMAITIILIWLRLMKNARASSTIGPFIVMLGLMAADILKIFFLYLEFFIPFACAFWMLYGGDQILDSAVNLPAVNATSMTTHVMGYQRPQDVIFGLFRLTLVDDYDFDGMNQIDDVMTEIILGAWFGLSAIVFLNLFIALMSDTFQRVYDNANANAVMQKAITILGIEENMSSSRRYKFRTHIHTKCAPEEKFYDDDCTESGETDLKKVTFQIKDKIDELCDSLQDEVTQAADKTPLKPLNSLRRSSLNTASLDAIQTLKQEFEATNRRQEQAMENMQKELESLHNTFRNMFVSLQRSAGPQTLVTYPQLQQPMYGTQQSLSTTQGVSPTDFPFNHYLPQTRPISRMNSGIPSSLLELETQETNSAALPPYHRSASRTGSFRKSQLNIDSEWEESEKQRKKELRKLRHRILRHSRSNSREKLMPPATEDDQPHPTVEISENPVSADVPNPHFVNLKAKKSSVQSSDDTNV